MARDKLIGEVVVFVDDDVQGGQSVFFRASQDFGSSWIDVKTGFDHHFGRFAE